jgi:1,4-alpha-glucan branching enzyme
MKKFTRTFIVTFMLVLSMIFATSAVIAAVAPLPAGVQEGINYIDDNTVVLVLLAPDKGTAEVTGTFNDWGLTEMNKTPDNEHFWIQLENLTAGQEYIYQYLVDGTIRISDPFAEKILDPWNDQDIPEENYPGLIAWGTDEDREKGLASVFQTAQEPYQWQVTDFQAPLQHHLVAYELLIRDWTEQRSFQSVIDSMPYLKKLGINAIELMPVNEFDGNLSWGYNPSHYFAVDKMYGPKEKLQELIDVAHQHGLAVIIDMVYNHTFNQSPLASLYWNPDGGTEGQPAQDNPWYNETPPHTCVAWGNDFDHESPYTQEFFDRVNKFWIEEFKIDGFRYDFTKGLTQTYSTSETWQDGQNCGNWTDWSRINIIKRMADKVWEVKDDAYIILEHWGNAEEEDELVSHGNGMLTWRKLHYNFEKLLCGEETNNLSLGGAQSDTRIVFSGSHDEERLAFSTLNCQSNATAMMQRMKLGAAFIYTVPGPKMLWMFEELAMDYSLFTCEDGSVQYNDGCKLAVKPFKWNEYMTDPNRVDVYETYADIINLRTQNQVFTHGYFRFDEDGDANFDDYETGALRQIQITHETMDVVIIGNFGNEGGSITPAFTKQGTWYNYLNKEYPTYEYTGQTSYYLAPGQFEIFTSVPIDDNQVLAPTNLTTTISGNDVTLNWVDNADNETAYRIERSTSATGGFVALPLQPVNTTSYIDQGLANGKYYYRVRANGDSEPSDYSETVPAQVGPTPGVKVHFKNTDNWNPVKIYVFDWDSKTAIDGWTWSGVNMTQESNSPWYTYTIEVEVTPGMVFNNGSGLKSKDLTRTTEGWYDFGSEQWYDVCPGDCPTPPVPEISVDKPGGEYEETVTVVLSASNNGNITYTTDGTDPRNGVDYNEALTFTSTTQLRAIATNNEGESDELDETYTVIHPVPVLTVDPKGGEFVGVIDVTLEASHNGVIYYTLDGSDPKNGTITHSGQLQFAGDTPLRAIALNDNGYSNEIEEYYDKVESTCDTIFYYNSNNWSTVNIYLFNANGDALAGWQWPGEPMIQIDNSKWYYFVNCETVDVGIVFNNGSGQQSDNEFSNSGWFYNGSWYTTCPGNCPGEQPEGLALHCKKPSDWSTVYLYYWSTTPSVSSPGWPGVPMSDTDGDGWYDYTIEGVECANVIFSNQGAPQTGNLTNVCEESWYDNGWVSDPGFKNAGMTAQINTFVSKPYPNPFSKEISIRISEADAEVTVQILSLKGSIVFTDVLSSENDGILTIHPSIPEGLYLLQITSKNTIQTFRILKE